MGLPAHPFGSAMRQRRVTLSLPGKTFLLGEYVALLGGPSLLVTSEPRFELHAEPAEDSEVHGIHPQSPAGRWLREIHDTWRLWRLSFHDPHAGKGGLGASSAQFAAVWIWSKWLTGTLSPLADPLPYERMWEDYRRLLAGADGRSVVPSGADVIAQAAGQICYFVQHPFSIETQPWPFSELDFLIVRTGQKLSTHEHLAKMGRDEMRREDTADLFDPVLEAQRALATGEPSLFVEAVRRFAGALAHRGWVAPATADWLSDIRQWPGVLAAKGNGAMGADTLLVLVYPERREEIIRRLATLELELVASSRDMSSGLRLTVDHGVLL